jgi:hypothetical protein
MYAAAVGCKHIARATVTNCEPHCVTLAGYCYAVRHGMKVQLVTPYRVSHLQRYEVTLQVWTHISASPEKQRGTRAMFTLTCNPAFTHEQNLKTEEAFY